MNVPYLQRQDNRVAHAQEIQAVLRQCLEYPGVYGGSIQRANNILLSWCCEQIVTNRLNRREVCYERTQSSPLSCRD